jgi:hypothetical protein
MCWDFGRFFDFFLFSTLLSKLNRRGGVFLLTFYNILCVGNKKLRPKFSIPAPASDFQNDDKAFDAQLAPSIRASLKYPLPTDDLNDDDDLKPHDPNQLSYRQYVHDYASILARLSTNYNVCTCTA